MSIVSVPLFGNPMKQVKLDSKATEGAVLGVNLFAADGTVYTLDQILNSKATTSGITNLSGFTSDDLQEGPFNLYFTYRRAQDAVGGILASSTTISLAYVAGTSITATLNDLADSGVGAALVRITRDAQGRISGTHAATTTDLTEGTNLYFTSARVLATTLTGLSTATATAVTAADSVLVGIGKLQGQATANAAAIATKEPAITAGTAAQYWRGDKTWQALDKTAVGLGNVDNTSDVNKPVSTAQSAADALNVPLDGSRTMTGELKNSNGRFTGGSSYAVLQTSNVTGAIIYLRPFANSSTGQLTVNPDGSFNTSGVFRTGGSMAPLVDNTYDLGSGALRMHTIYAGTGTINTSDAREKTEVVPMTSDELAASADLGRAIGTYQWLASVAEKGDAARHHAGLTVQCAIEILQAHGLDPMRYGFICYDQWDEQPEIVNTDPAKDAVLDDEGNVVTPAVDEISYVAQPYRPAGDRYSFRPDELCLFLARGFDARLSALEAGCDHT